MLYQLLILFLAVLEWFMSANDTFCKPIMCRFGNIVINVDTGLFMVNPTSLH